MLRVEQPLTRAPSATFIDVLVQAEDADIVSPRATQSSVPDKKRRGKRRAAVGADPSLSKATPSKQDYLEASKDLDLYSAAPPTYEQPPTYVAEIR